MDPILKKLQFKNYEKILVLNLPHNLFELKTLWENETTVVTQAQGEFQFALCFVQNQQAIKTTLAQLTNHLEDDALLWMAYPKNPARTITQISVEIRVGIH